MLYAKTIYTNANLHAFQRDCDCDVGARIILLFIPAVFTYTCRTHVLIKVQRARSATFAFGGEREMPRICQFFTRNKPPHRRDETQPPAPAGAAAGAADDSQPSTSRSLTSLSSLLPHRTADEVSAQRAEIWRYNLTIAEAQTCCDNLEVPFFVLCLCMSPPLLRGIHIQSHTHNKQML